MTDHSEYNYDAIVIDTSIFIANGLKLEKGALDKMNQFKNSKIKYILPTVIKDELKNKLINKAKLVRSSLDKSIKDANDYLFLVGSELDREKINLIEESLIDKIVTERIQKFIDNTGALVLDCGEYASISEVLDRYFKNLPPFKETGNKKNEFPDAIALIAVNKWAEKNAKEVLIVSKDKDWEEFCPEHNFLGYENDLVEALNLFHNEINLTDKISKYITDDKLSVFLDKIKSRLSDIINDLSPDINVESSHYWELDYCTNQLLDVSFSNNIVTIADKNEDTITIGFNMNISVDFEGEFSFSYEDLVDKDYVKIGSFTKNKTENFISKVLVTISNYDNLEPSEFIIEDVEIVNRIDAVYFGWIEPSYDL